MDLSAMPAQARAVHIIIAASHILVFLLLIIIIIITASHMFVFLVIISVMIIIPASDTDILITPHNLVFVFLLLPIIIIIIIHHQTFIQHMGMSILHVFKQIFRFFLCDVWQEQDMGVW